MPPLDFNAFFQRLKANTPIQNQSQLARILGIGRAAVSSAKHKNKVPSSWIVTLTERYGLAASELIGKESPGIARSGSTVFQDGKPRSEPLGGQGFKRLSQLHRVRFHEDWLKSLGDPNHLMAMTIHENNMSPEIQPGDLVIIDTSQRTALNGHLFVFNTENGPTLRRVDGVGDSLNLLSTHPAYPPVTVTRHGVDHPVIAGRVLVCLRAYTNDQSPVPTSDFKESTAQKKADGQFLLFPST